VKAKVARKAGVEQVLAKKIQEFGPIDALVNNEGGFEFKPSGKNIRDRRGRMDEIREL
jgi:hypothetical protein